MLKKVKVLPETLVGKAAVICLVAFLLLVSISGLAKDFQAQDFAISPIGGFFEHIILLVALSALTAATFLGIYAFFKLKDYSLLVGVTALLGAAMIISQI